MRPTRLAITATACATALLMTAPPAWAEEPPVAVPCAEAAADPATGAWPEGCPPPVEADAAPAAAEPAATTPGPETPSAATPPPEPAEVEPAGVEAAGVEPAVVEAVEVEPAAPPALPEPPAPPAPEPPNPAEPTERGATLTPALPPQVDAATSDVTADTAPDPDPVAETTDAGAGHPGDVGTAPAGDTVETVAKSPETAPSDTEPGEAGDSATAPDAAPAPEASTAPTSGTGLSIVTGPLVGNSGLAPGGSFQGSMAVEVIDHREGSPGWVAQVQMPQFVHTQDPALVFRPDNATYESHDTECSLSLGRQKLALKETAVQRATTTCATTWNADIRFTVPTSGVPAGAYTTTIVHSVA